MRTPTLLSLLCLTALSWRTNAFSPPSLASFFGNNNNKSTTTPPEESVSLATKDAVQKIAVTGATGRTGRLVVEELLERGVSEVVAIVRSTEKAQQVFADTIQKENLKIVQVDLLNEKEIKNLCESLDATIWCATGFSSSNDTPVLERVKSVWGSLVTKRTIDTVGLPAFGKFLSKRTHANGAAPLPKLVMCSSAGVTRPIWDDAKKEVLVGAADIPIVRLNPFGILDLKRTSEELLRETDVDYCIVRPSGLNDSWPAGARPILSQGDVAVGRINRRDVAQVLVDVLTEPDATGKTFEVNSVQGYPPAASLAKRLASLRSDAQGLPPLEQIEGTYNVLQQLLPGEQQDAAALAMGQTYEQLDKGEVGRLGKRGEEKLSRISD